MHASLKKLLPVLLITIIASLYWPSLQYMPFFDDKNFFERGALDAIFLNGFVFELRWLPYFTTAWIDLIFDDKLFAQRVTSLGLHLATAFVLYSLVRQVSNHVAPHRNNERAALAAALLFLLHPLTVYAVGYLIQRTILMATLFGLLSLSTYFDGLVTRKKAYFFFSAFFYLLSAFSKEHAVLIPAAALALTPLAMPITRQTWRALVLPISLFLPIAGLVVFKSQHVIGNAYEPFAAALVQQQVGQSQSVMWGLSVMTQATLFFKYMGLVLLPNPDWMSIDMRVPFAAHFGDVKYGVGLLAFVLYGLIALRWLMRGGRVGLAGFALLAPWLLFLVEFSAVKIQEPFVLYRSYLWIPPLFLLIPAVSHSLSNKVFWGVVLAVALGFSYATHDRLKSFSSEYALWDDAVRKLPNAHALGSARAHSNRGFANLKRNDFHADIKDFTRALRSDASHQEAYRNRAYAYLKLGNYRAAFRDANTLIQAKPDVPHGFMSRGNIYRTQGDLVRAKQDFDRACELKSGAGCVASRLVQGMMAAKRTQHKSKPGDF